MKRPTLICAAVLCLLAACSKQPDMGASAAADPTEMAAQTIAAAPAAPPMASRAADMAGAAEAPMRRYRAVRHELLLQTADPAAVEPAWRRAEQACEAVGCEVLGSMLMRDDTRGPAGAQLEARLPPDKLEAFLQQVSALGSVGQHSKTAEDKTDEVIDTEARLRNMTELRDKLRGLLGTREARLRDLLEVERELARVQADLDSLAARRKALAQQTDKVLLVLRIAARPSVLQDGVWSPVADAVTGAGHVLARSLAALIGVVVGALPWAVLIGAGFIGLRFAWRRRRAPA
jgi:hypothetical protein